MPIESGIAMRSAIISSGDFFVHTQTRRDIIGCGMGGEWVSLSGASAGIST